MCVDEGWMLMVCVSKYVSVLLLSFEQGNLRGESGVFITLVLLMLWSGGHIGGDL